MRRCLILIFAFVLFCAPPAIAQPEQNAALLQKQITDALDWYHKLAEATGVGLFITQPVTVTEDDDSYLATISGIQFVLMEGFTLQPGSVQIRAKARQNDAPGWIVQFMVPDIIPVYDAATQKIGTIKSGDKALDAVWLPEIGMFPKFDFSLQSMSFIPEGNVPFALQLKSFATKADLKQIEDSSKFSGPTSMNISGFELLSMTDQADIEIKVDSADTVTEYDQLDLSTVQSAKQAVVDLLEAAQNDVKQKVLAAETNRMLTEALVAPENMDTKFSLNGVSMRIIPTVKAPKEVDIVSFTAKRFETTTKLSDMSQDIAAIDFIVHLDNAVASGLPDEILGVIPAEGRLRFGVKKVPVDTLRDYITETVSIIMAAPGDIAQRNRFQDRLLMLPVLLANAGLEIYVQNTQVGARDLSVRIEADLKLTQEHDYAILGDARFEIGGLDEFVIRMRQQSQNPQQTQFYAAMMAPMQLMGQLEKDDNGRSKRVYHFELKKDGMVFLNGADFMAARSALQGR